MPIVLCFTYKSLYYVITFITLPASSESDESDKDWKAKIMSTRNMMRGGINIAPASAVIRPLVSTILEVRMSSIFLVLFGE